MTVSAGNRHWYLLSSTLDISETVNQRGYYLHLGLVIFFTNYTFPRVFLLNRLSIE